MPDLITSTKNETVKSVAKLKRTRERRHTGRILVEGPNGFDEALNAGLQPIVVLLTEDDDVTRTKLVGHPAVEMYVVTQNVLDSVADATHPRSPVIVVRRPSPDVVRSHNLCVLVDVSDPGNAGAIIRTAAAFGWDIAYTPDCVDIWSPKVLRSAAGAHFRTNLVPLDLNANDATLAEHTVVATVVSGGDSTIDANGPFALLVGSEPLGLDAKHVAMTSHRLTIEMRDSMDSLNVAAASAIAMYLLR
jgi:TrmH family RNA methyltransferase